MTCIFAHRNQGGAPRGTPGILTSRDCLLLRPRHRRRPAGGRRAAYVVRTVLGRTDFTVTELEADCATRHGASGWYDDDGALVAYGWVLRIGASPKVEVDAYVDPSHDPTSASSCWPAWSNELASSSPRPGTTAVCLRHRRLSPGRAHSGWLRAAGSQSQRPSPGCASTSTRPVEVPPVAGVTVRRSDADDADLRLAHGSTRRPSPSTTARCPDFDAFRARFTEHGEGWSSLWLAELDGTPVGLLVGTEAVRRGRRRGLCPPHRRHPRWTRAWCRKSVAA